MSKEIYEKNIVFYELSQTTLESFLPRLLEKVYAQKQKALVIFDTDEMCLTFNQIFWTYSTLSFLPHGCYKDLKEKKKEIPLWLTSQERFEDDRESSYLILITTCATIIPVEKVPSKMIDVFSSNPHAREAAKERALYYNKHAFNNYLYVQDSKGSWGESSF